MALKSRDLEKKEEKGMDSHFHGNDREERRNNIKGRRNNKGVCYTLLLEREEILK